MPLGPASRSSLDSGLPLRNVGASIQTHQVGAGFEALIEGVLMAPLDSRYAQVGFNFISVQVCLTKQLSEHFILVLLLLPHLLLLAHLLLWSHHTLLLLLLQDLKVAYNFNFGIT